MSRAVIAFQRSIAPIVILACLHGSTALAQTPAGSPAPVTLPASSKLPAEAFFKSPEVLDAKLSPSGRQLAFTSASGAKRVALVVADLDGSGKLVRSALFADLDVASFDWVNDDRLVFNVVDLADRYAAPGLFAVNADGSGLRQLVARKTRDGVVAAQRPGRETLAWNHGLLFVPRLQPGPVNEEVIVGEWDFYSSYELKQVIPLWLNTRTGRTRSMDLKAPSHTVQWLFDSRGEARVAVTRAEGRQSMNWRGPGQTAWQTLSEHDALQPPFTPVAVDDAGTLFVTRQVGAQGHASLTRYDFGRKAPSPDPWVTVEGFDFDGHVLMPDAGGAALGVRTEADAEVTVWFDEKMKAFQKKVDERFPGGVNRVSCRRCGQPDAVALVRHYADRDPGQLWVYREDGEQWKAVSQVQRGIDPRHMATVALERIQARDGRELPVWLTLPPGREPGRPGPAVVLVHGGPWMRGGHWQWSAMEQFLASRGYLVISPDFRGSTGYGDAHFKAGWKQWGQAMQDDVADAVRWAQKEGLADRRVCIAGASYGGYSTLMGLVRDPDLYRCGVAWAAVTDLSLLLEGSWFVIDDLGDSARRYWLTRMVADPNLDSSAIARASPVAQAEHIRAPLLLAFGEEDHRVPLAHGKRLREALQKAGRDSLWVSYPDEGHGWRLPQNQTDFARRVEKFLAAQLQ